MNLEFHYYVIHFLAKRAGFCGPDAETIAYSSQFVDNAVLCYQVNTPRGSYDTVISQNYVFWNEATLRNAYLPFHFIPAGIRSSFAQRADRGANPWCVAPDSGPAKEILIAGLKTRNLYRVGIALHAYADTWAHQNFSGLHEEWNRIDELSPVPFAAHAQALTAPDELDRVWEDPRLAPPWNRIVNRQRFIQAAEKIYKYLRTFRKEAFDDIDFVMHDLENIWGKPGSPRPMAERIFEYILAADIAEYDRKAWMHEAGVYDSKDSSDTGFSGYDKLLWLKQELRGRAGMSRKVEVEAGNEFFNSRYYQWNLAATEHRKNAQDILRAKGLLP